MTRPAWRRFQASSDVDRATDTSHEAADDDDDRRGQEAYPAAPHGVFDRLNQKRDRQNRHSPLLWQKPAKILELAERAAQNADIRGEDGEQRRQPAKPWIARGIAERHQK
jgi:hypothetical protein